LFVNQPFTFCFEGMTRDESLPLLQYLYQVSHKPELTCRFRWQPGSMAFWDNRCTMHYAINDYPGQRREMHRITIQGVSPT
jgi:taurine dioxygenase